MKPEFSRQVFERCSNTKFRENLSTVSQAAARRRNAEANSSFSQFCGLAYKDLCYSASLSYRLQPFAYATHQTPESENLPHSDGAQVFLSLL